MKLHVVRSSDPRYPILMLSHYAPTDIDHLCDACHDLASRRKTVFALHEQTWVEASSGCQFYWQYCEKDVGVLLPLPGDPFVLQYSDEAWLEVESKLSIMRDAPPGHVNELTMEGEVPVMVSPDGKP